MKVYEYFDANIRKKTEKTELRLKKLFFCHFLKQKTRNKKKLTNFVG